MLKMTLSMAACALGVLLLAVAVLGMEPETGVPDHIRLNKHTPWSLEMVVTHEPPHTVLACDGRDR